MGKGEWIKENGLKGRESALWFWLLAGLRPAMCDSVMSFFL
jgi:hypothetical protein